MITEKQKNILTTIITLGRGKGSINIDNTLDETITIRLADGDLIDINVLQCIAVFADHTLLERFCEKAEKSEKKYDLKGLLNSKIMTHGTKNVHHIKNLETLLLEIVDHLSIISSVEFYCYKDEGREKKIKQAQKTFRNWGIAQDTSTEKLEEFPEDVILIWNARRHTFQYLISKGYLEPSKRSFELETRVREKLNLFSSLNDKSSIEDLLNIRSYNLNNTGCDSAVISSNLKVITHTAEDTKEIEHHIQADIEIPNRQNSNRKKFGVIIDYHELLKDLVKYREEKKNNKNIEQVEAKIDDVRVKVENLSEVQLERVRASLNNAYGDEALTFFNSMHKIAKNNFIANNVLSTDRFKQNHSSNSQFYANAAVSLFKLLAEETPVPGAKLIATAAGAVTSHLIDKQQSRTNANNQLATAGMNDDKLAIAIALVITANAINSAGAQIDDFMSGALLLDCQSKIKSSIQNVGEAREDLLTFITRPAIEVINAAKARMNSSSTTPMSNEFMGAMPALPAAPAPRQQQVAEAGPCCSMM